jgi:TonB family protein
VKTLIKSLLLCCIIASQAYAQDSTKWIDFVPPGDYFQVSLPEQPKVKNLNGLKTNYGDLDISGKLYEASNGTALFRLWTLTNPGDNSRQRSDPDAYLDGCAELLWEGLLKAERDQLPKVSPALARMTYVKEISDKSIRGREYTLTIGSITGTSQIYVAESRTYVLLATNATAADWVREPFFHSFSVGPTLPGQIKPEGPEKPSLISSPNDIRGNEQVFTGRDVALKARLLEKPEPTYTDSARKFGVQGTVVLRAIFSKSGEVTNFWVVSKLPHGMTQRPIAAARRIRFTPAMKDGQPVSMWMELQYNFNLF